MRVAIVDADLIGRKKHRFPNLACMKLSGYHKAQGDQVELVTDWWTMGYDKVYVSKVFTDTEVPEEVLAAPNVVCGGTGFFYEKAPPLPEEVEHSFPDYHLYDDWVRSKLEAGGKRKDYVYYLDYSIGFLTRGCFRKCAFCVNKTYDRCFPHSPLSEFMDPERPKLCFLDDNFFACPKWEQIIAEVQTTGKRFQFKQGLDERLLTDKKIHSLMSWNYDKDFIFAFDNIEDRPIIEKKLRRIRELYPDSRKHLKFYVLCGFDNMGGWSVAWRQHDAQFHGVPQRRKRIALVADFNGLTAPAILFDPQYRRETEGAEPDEAVSDFGAGPRSSLQAVKQGLPRHTEPRGTAGEGTAEGIAGGSGGANRTDGTDGAGNRLSRDCDGVGRTEKGIAGTPGAISFQERSGKPGGAGQ